MRVAFKIQAFVMRLPPNECLAARNGRDFPLSEDEMRWQLGYFGINAPEKVAASPSAET